MDENVDVFLEHHGVKGMKWGIINQQRLDRISRVASGKATKSERTNFALTESSVLSLVKNGGIQGSAQHRKDILEQRKKRIKAGEATVRDFLALHGGDKFIIG